MNVAKVEGFEFQADARNYMKLSNSNTVDFSVLLGQHYLLRKQLVEFKRTSHN